MSHNILAVETATPVCSVALRINGATADELRQTGTGIHSEMVFVFTDELLKRNNIKLSGLDAIILSGGPGSYTGLRVGSSAVKGMLFGSDTGFYAANTLAAIALGAKIARPDAGRIHAVLDARRKHLYHQPFRFADDIIAAETDSAIQPLADFDSILHEDDLIAGTGIERLPEQLTKNKSIGDESIISALNLFTLYDLSQSTNLSRASRPLIKKVAPELFEPYY